MKKTTRVILGSAMSIAMSAALIAGSTFALFSSESDVNIAITSGKVSVAATAQLTKVYSAEWNESEKTYTDKVLFDTCVEGTPYSFTNEGTAMYEGKTLTLSNISAGDGVEFQINVENDSTIAIKYQTVVTFVGGGKVGEDPSVDHSELYKALKIKVDGDEDISSDRTTAVSDWTEVPTAGGAIDPITVDIRLPWQATDVQDMTCDIVIGVYAVQSNGHDETNQNVYLVSADSDLGAMVGSLPDGSTLAFAEDISCDETLSFENKDVTLDLNGNEMTLGLGGSLAADEGATVTLSGEGKITVAEENAAEKVDCFITAGNNVGTTTTLNIDCEVDLDNMHEEGGYAYCGIYAEGDTSENEDSKVVVNIMENADLHRSLADGSIIEAESNAEINMLGGKISVTASKNSTNTNWVASAIWLDEGALFNLSDGEIIAEGYNVAAINLWGTDSKFCMTGGKIVVEIDVNHGKGTPSSSAVEVYDGALDMTGGVIEVKSNITQEGPKACGIYASKGQTVNFGEDARIIVHKTGEGGSERNFSVVTYSDVPVYDETGSTGTILEEMKEQITNWTLSGTVELVRD